MKLVSDRYTIYINGNNVTMACNQTRMPHSLSNLCITHNDIDFYLKTQRMGYNEKSEALRAVIVSGDIAKLNNITNERFDKA